MMEGADDGGLGAVLPVGPKGKAPGRRSGVKLFAV